jgi:hypothetical protein
MKKRKRAGAAVPGTKGPFDLGGFPHLRIASLPGSTSRGGGRLRTKVTAPASQPPLPVDKKQPTEKSLSRWEGEGGSPAPRTTASHRAKKTEPAHTGKKAAVINPSKKAKPRAGTAGKKNRR